MALATTRCVLPSWRNSKSNSTCAGRTSGLPQAAQDRCSGFNMTVFNCCSDASSQIAHGIGAKIRVRADRSGRMRADHQNQTPPHTLDQRRESGRGRRCHGLEVRRCPQCADRVPQRRFLQWSADHKGSRPPSARALGAGSVDLPRHARCDHVPLHPPRGCPFRASPAKARPESLSRSTRMCMTNTPNSSPAEKCLDLWFGRLCPCLDLCQVNLRSRLSSLDTARIIAPHRSTGVMSTTSGMWSLA